MMMISINAEPMGAVRMTRRGKFVKPAAQRYMNYKQLLGFHMRAQCDEPIEGPVSLSATFYMPMPISWSGKKRREHLEAPVTVKPDADNLVKGLMDAANGILWKDDNQVTDVQIKKRYAVRGHIFLTVEEVLA